MHPYHIQHFFFTLSDVFLFKVACKVAFVPFQFSVCSFNAVLTFLHICQENT